MYKEIDLDNYKYIYEKTLNQIEEMYNYYNIVMDNIEMETYMSPSDYLISRNISFIYSALNYAKNNAKNSCDFFDFYIDFCLSCYRDTNICS